MVFRINWRNFLIHMIDWFDYSDLINMWWVVLSYEIASTGGCNRVWKPSSDGGVFPPGAIVDYYDETRDYETCKNMYFDYLLKRDDDINVSPAVGDIYAHIAAPMKRYCNVCMIYTVEESWICDALCEFLKKYFAIDVVDLDHLFKEGWVQGFYLDREKIWEKTSEIEIEAKLGELRDKIRTPAGRAEIVAKMTKKQKIKKLKDLGIKVTQFDDVDRLLHEAWVTPDT